MFWDHGNTGGVLFGFLLLALGLPAWVAWIGFAVGFILTAYLDLAPLRATFHVSAYGERVVVVGYDYAIYNYWHDPPKTASLFVRLCPFFLLHRVEDLPAHSERAKKSIAFRNWVYVNTAVLGWIMLYVFWRFVS